MGAREVMKRVRDGYRLERPAHCHPDLYAIIQKCWLGDMNKRPDFSELRKVITTCKENQKEGKNVSGTWNFYICTEPVFSLSLFLLCYMQ